EAQTHRENFQAIARTTHTCKLSHSARKKPPIERSMADKSRRVSPLEANFQAKLYLAWCTQREHTRAITQTGRRPVRCRGAVGVPGCSIQQSSELVTWPIEIGEIENIE